MKKAVSFSIILIGFTAMASQIVLIREFLTVFYGNELSISLILLNWLAGGAVGSLFLGRYADRIKRPAIVFCAMQAALSVMVTLNVPAIRLIRTIIKVNPGEIVPLFPAAVSSLVILAPSCIILGFMFVLACRVYPVQSRKPQPLGRGLNGVYESERHKYAAGISKVYVLEAIGSIAGGLLVSFFLIRFLNSECIMAELGFLNIASSLFLLVSHKEAPSRGRFAIIIGLFLLANVLMWPLGGWDFIDRWSLDKQWEGYELVASKNSIYGNIAVTKKLDQFSFFDSGLHLYTVPDRLRQEEAVHFALLEHPSPRDVLLVGGGVGGLIEEIIKHPVKTVDYLEIDPLIIKMAKQYLPKEYYDAVEDRRVTVKNMDGRFFIKTTDKRYDCVILNVGDPYTAQLNRFYTVEFFKEARRVLKKGGIVSFSVTSSENYINSELKTFLESLYATLKKVFADVKIIPGDTAFFLAADEQGRLVYDYNILMGRMRQRGMDLKYVREYYLSSKLSGERISYIEEAVRGGPAVKANYDFRPVAYYYDIIFWASRFRDSLFGRMLKAVTEETVWKAALILYGLIIVFWLAAARYKRLVKSAVLTALAVAGFNGLTFQVMILLSFQIIYGYLFYKLGAIFTFFMVGLALGGWTAVHMMRREMRHNAVFLAAQCASGAYFLFLPAVFAGLAGSKSGLIAWVGSNVIFSLLPVLAGFMGGLQFSLANKIYLNEDDRAGRAAGLTYGIDLAGSCAGALAAGIFLIPLLGMAKACLAAALLNFAVSILLLAIL